MKWFLKYGFVVLLFNTILYQIDSTKDTIAPIIFYVLMGVGLLTIIVNPSQMKEVIFHKSFLFLLLLNLINLLYLVIFDDILNRESVQFLMARFIQFSLISFAVYYNFDYFKDRFPKLLINIILLVVIISLVSNPYIFSGRYQGITWNPNEFSTLLIFAFAFLLLRNSKKTYKELFLLFLLFGLILLTGSRAALIAIVIAFVYKFGLSTRNFIYAIMSIFLYLLISSTNLNTSINRVTNQGAFEGRAEQWEFALYNLQEKPFTGHGLSEYSGLPESSLISDNQKGKIMSAHNGYLSILLQYGLLFGLLVIFVFLKKSVEVLKFFKDNSDYNV
ncbi:MAG: O-antigen ligase family protein, partial [Flavobacteriales bacterium]|nr:O-antigen ligase family protein [Flavobacteriales bacterium]